VITHGLPIHEHCPNPVKGLCDARHVLELSVSGDDDPYGLGSFATFTAIRSASSWDYVSRPQFVEWLTQLCNGRFRTRSSCHHVSTAAFPASQPFDELANRSIRPYSKTCKFPFSDYAFVTAREALY